jgi:glyoxylase-like metal-dependent hydrolase (beta-lactamase superfamily II)
MRAWSLAWNSAEVSFSNNSTRIIQIRHTGKGCLSYLIGSAEEAAVIDASLPPEIYLNLAQKNGWKIRRVIDTHIHADHLSRGRRLAAENEAIYYLPEQDRVTFPYEGIQDGDRLKIGSAELRVIATPGHSLESSCYLLDDQALFTGDTLFLASVGRPDLKAEAGETEKRAYLLHKSLQSLQSLKPETIILPGHSSEPIPFDNQPYVASLAQVSQRVDLLALTADEFARRLLARIPDAPPNHLRIAELNEAGKMPETNVIVLEAGANRCAVA